MDWYDILLRVSAAMGFLAVLATVVVVIRGAALGARVKELRETNEELRDERDDHERRAHAYKLQKEACDIVVEQLNTEVQRLTDLALQRADVEGVKVEVTRLLGEMQTHHDQAMNQWQHMNTALQQLIEQKKDGNNEA